MLWGMVALVVVSALLGLLVGVGTLAGSRLVGLGGSTGDSTGDGGDTLYLPDVSLSKTPVSDSSSGSDGSSQPGTPTKTKKRKAKTAISLTAGQRSVAPMQQIDLTGTYPGGDGAILQVQRLDGGQWVAFPVTTQVSGGSFSTYIQTGRPGPNRFRVADTAKGKFSNRVTVTIG